MARGDTTTKHRPSEVGKVLPTHLHHARTHAQVLKENTTWSLGLAATGLQTVGKLLHQHACSDDKRFTDLEVEGLCLTVEALGEYVQYIQASVERIGDMMEQFIEKGGPQ